MAAVLLQYNTVLASTDWHGWRGLADSISIADRDICVLSSHDPDINTFLKSEAEHCRRLLLSSLNVVG
eukprot:3486667-Pyramimonas_sp.AAC.5